LKARPSITRRVCSTEQFSSKAEAGDPASNLVVSQATRFAIWAQAIAFSSEVDTGSREENASNRNHGAPLLFNQKRKCSIGEWINLAVFALAFLKQGSIANAGSRHFAGKGPVSD
jgi:hypothetical protein